MDRETVHRRRWQILAVLCLSLTVIGLDNLILNLALPSIQDDLKATGSDLQWAIDAYTLPFGGLLLFCGSLGDRFGRKRLLLLGLAIFLGFSVLAAFAGSAEVLIAARAAMGVGSALIMPATLSIIKDVFPASEQAKAIGIWAAAASLGVPLGPVIGGVLLEYFWWGSVFLVNVPIVVIALVFGRMLIPESRNENKPRLDIVGMLLSVAGLGGVVYGIIEAPRAGWGDVAVLGPLVAGVLLMVAFVWWERRTTSPMLSSALFRKAQFSGAAAAVFFMNFVMFGLLFVVTLHFQFVLGYSPIEAGLSLLCGGTIILGSPLGEKLVEKVGFKQTVTFGLMVIVASAVVLAGTDGSSGAAPFWALGLFGLGMGLTGPACANAILAASPAHQAGAGSAVTDASMQVGGALGIAVTGSVLSTGYQNALPSNVALPAPVTDSIGGAAAVADELGGEQGASLLRTASTAFIEGMHESMYLGAGVAAVGVLICVFVLPRRIVAADEPDQTTQAPVPVERS